MSTTSMDDVLPLHLARVTFPDFHPLRGQTGEVMGFAIRHPGGIILFDTGIGAGNGFIDRHYQPTRHSLEAALERHDHRLADVVAIVNSHLHFDHCGNNPLFPGVPIYAQRGELDAARRPLYTVPDWIDFPGAEYRLIDGEERVAAGVRIVATPGHTSGHQSLVLDGASGGDPIVLAGQAIYSRAEYDHIDRYGSLPDDDPPPDDPAYLVSATQLIELRPRRVHFSHDVEVWSATPA
jgi:glyoxylase-like metal-dependent hydrolase (beta-lactamase superfamily II)